MKLILTILLTICTSLYVSGQCDQYSAFPAQSPRIANYNIEVKLNLDTKKAVCKQTIRWHNPSNQPVERLLFYMYVNAFKNSESTFMKGADLNSFGINPKNVDDLTWGYIELNQIKDQNSGASLMENWQYIQPDDGNNMDQSVMEITLDEPISPHDSIVLYLEYEVKLPRLMIRTGYSKNHFYSFLHWFPQLGVFEKSDNGEWNWNCHQFFRRTEFYADFGNYDVTLVLPEDLIVGATGCLTEKINSDGYTSHRFIAYDVIDFAWVAYPDFEVYHSAWQGVDIELLVPPEHSMLVDRFITSIKQSLEYLDDHIGPYPYPKITLMDPPIHALRSGFMEYPMFITGGSIYRAPSSIRTFESLVVHEFSHQYFMATLASNEKEEAWLDEGFVTYYENRILDHYYGQKESLFNVLGYQSGNAENTRLEYTRLPNPDAGIIARPGWEIANSYKGLVYSKTATCLTTLERHIGKDLMDEIIRVYFDQYKFKHPTGNDFYAIAVSLIGLPLEDNTFEFENFWQQCIYEAVSVDFSVNGISHSKESEPMGIIPQDNGPRQESSSIVSTTTIEKSGDFIIPVEIDFYFSDNSCETRVWDGVDNQRTFEFKKEFNLKTVSIDPNQKVFLDLNFNNNSYTLAPNKKPLYKYGAKTMHWLQNLLQFTSSLLIISNE